MPNDKKEKLLATNEHSRKNYWISIAVAALTIIGGGIAYGVEVTKHSCQFKGETENSVYGNIGDGDIYSQTEYLWYCANRTETFRPESTVSFNDNCINPIYGNTTAKVTVPAKDHSTYVSVSTRDAFFQKCNPVLEIRGGYVLTPPYIPPAS